MRVRSKASVRVQGGEGMNENHGVSRDTSRRLCIKRTEIWQSRSKSQEAGRTGRSQRKR